MYFQSDDYFAGISECFTFIIAVSEAYWYWITMGLVEVIICFKFVTPHNKQGLHFVVSYSNAQFSNTFFIVIQIRWKFSFLWSNFFQLSLHYKVLHMHNTVLS